MAATCQVACPHAVRIIFVSCITPSGWGEEIAYQCSVGLMARQRMHIFGNQYHCKHSACYITAVIVLLQRVLLAQIEEIGAANQAVLRSSVTLPKSIAMESNHRLELFFVIQSMFFLGMMCECICSCRMAKRSVSMT